MQSRKKDNTYISAARCDRALNYLSYAREANCSSSFFKDAKQQDERMRKCAEATEKMAEIAELCSKKFA